MWDVSFGVKSARLFLMISSSRSDSRITVLSVYSEAARSVIPCFKSEIGVSR